VRRQIIVVVAALALTIVTSSALAAVRVTERPGRVSPGDKASVTITVSPKARCTIGVYYSTGRSAAHGLGSKYAKTITWTWTVGSATKAGTWPIKIECGKSGTAQTTVVVR